MRALLKSVRVRSIAEASQQRLEHAAHAGLPLLTLAQPHGEQLKPLQRAAADLRVRLDEHPAAQVQLDVHARQRAQQPRA